MKNNNSFLYDGLFIFRKTVLSFVVQKLQEAYGKGWWKAGVQGALGNDVTAKLEKQFSNRYGKTLSAVNRPGTELEEMLDIGYLLPIIQKNWKRSFVGIFQEKDTTEVWLREIIAARNAVAHPEKLSLSDEDTLRALDTMVRFVKIIDLDSAEQIAYIQKTLLNKEANQSEIFRQDNTEKNEHGPSERLDENDQFLDISQTTPVKKEQNEIFAQTQEEHNQEKYSTPFFVGREAQFELFEKYLKRNQPISIEGLGGIGKTAFAEKCIERFELTDRAVWFPCTRESKLESLIETAGFPDLLKIENLTERAKYSGFASLLDRHEKMVFLDDFQEITDPSFAKFLQFIKEYPLQKGRIILIAREHPEIGVLPSRIRLQGLEVDHAFDYAQHILEHNYPELDIDEEDIRAISQQFKGHPLAIELAIYLLDFGTAPEHLLQAVIDYENEEFLARRLLDEIFTHPKSTEEEKEFMLAFSVFRGKVKEEAFTYLFEGKDVNSTIRRLRRKLMLLSEDGFYETHPLVREFCYDRLANKQEWHKKAAEYFQSQRTEQLDSVLEETIFYHLSSSEQWQVIIDLICARGEQFILSGYTDVLKDMLDVSCRQGRHSPQFDLFYGEIAEIQGEWDQALHYFEHAFSATEADEKIQAQGKIQYGEILRSKGDVKASLAYFEQGYEICRAIHFQRGEARSLDNIGLAYRFFGDFDAAKAKIEASLKLRQQMGNISDIADSLNNLGGILEEQGDFDGARTHYHRSFALYEEIDAKFGIAVSLNNLGSLLRSQCNFDDARQLYQRSLTLSEEIGAKFGIAASLNNLGGLLEAQGDFDGARELYQRSLTLSEEIGAKFGIAASLNNLGLLLKAQGDFDGAQEHFQRSLALLEEMEGKLGIAKTLYNLGSLIYDQKRKNYPLSLHYFLKSYILQQQIETPKKETERYIANLRRKLGLQRFTHTVEDILQQLSDDQKPYLNVDKFLQDDTVRRTEPKVGRNDPCPCGSGKKYKKCCGR